MISRRYQICTGSGNGREKNYYFDDIDSVVAKAKQLQKRRKDNDTLVIIEIEVSPYFIKAKAEVADIWLQNKRLRKYKKGGK